MSSFTHRVYLPDDSTIYVSDDCAGDNRLVELYRQHGDLKVETCEKILGRSLDELQPLVTGTITSTFYE